MKTRLLPALIALVLMTFCCLPAACSADETEPEIPETDQEQAEQPVPDRDTDPATPTDLDCAHLNVVTTVYFFDSPAYKAVSAVAHRVAGAGIVETVCRDCGKVLSDETTDNAEEIRPHSFKKGVCALCGYQQAAQADQEFRDAPGERTMIAQPDGNGMLFVTLTELDLNALEKASVETLLIRGEMGKAAVAVDVPFFRSEVEEEQASLSVEMSEQEDGSLFAGLSLSTAPGKTEELADTEGVMIRFYQEENPVPRVIFAGEDQEIRETEISWQEEGYWAVPYMEEGSYLLTY